MQLSLSLIGSSYDPSRYNWLLSFLYILCSKLDNFSSFQKYSAHFPSLFWFGSCNKRGRLTRLSLGKVVLSFSSSFQLPFFLPFPIISLYQGEIYIFFIIKLIGPSSTQDAGNRKQLEKVVGISSYQLHMVMFSNSANIYGDYPRKTSVYHLISNSSS